MQLNISQIILNKLNYFLRKFSNKEWSGPAWYELTKKDEHGFPEEFNFVDFHPLDLGGHSSTEWDASDLAKIIKEKYKLNKKYKSCYLGLVHSHHDMGAFFSGTDEGTLMEMAPNTGFYPSLVVSTKADKNYAFAISYLDQYNQGTIFNGKVDIPSPKAAKEWVAIAEEIEKKSKVTIYSPKRGYTGYNGYQGALWHTDPMEEYDDETLQKGKDIWSKFKNPQNEMDYNQMMKKMDELKIIQPYTIFGGTGWTY